MQKKFFFFLAVGFMSLSSAQATPDCSRLADSLPFEQTAMGTKNPKIPLQHIIVIMQVIIIEHMRVRFD